MDEVRDLEFKLLGGLEAYTRSGDRVEFSNRKVAQLTALLAAAPGKRWTRTSLAVILWPESFQDAALASLRQALALLKKNLLAVGLVDEELFLKSKLDVEFRRDKVGSDVDDFDQLTRVAKEAEGWQKTLEQYTGVFVPEWKCDWAEAERTRLSAESAKVLSFLVDRLLEDGNSVQAAATSAKLLAVDPTCEGKTQQTIRALTANGNGAEAIKVYRRFERMLRETLGLTPAQATIELAKAARKQSSQRRSLPPGNLPKRLLAYFGREPEIEGLNSWLSDPTCRVITIVGPGGIGKTRLALEVGTRQEATDGLTVWFTELASVERSEQIVDHVLDLLQAEPDAPRTIETIGHIVQDRRALLILDNLEQVGPGIGAVITALTEACPKLVVLCTTRQRTGALHETLLELAPLPVPGDEDAPSLFASFQLFVDRAKQDGTQIKPGDHRAIAEIVRKVEGSPLAICLAAAQTSTLTPSQIVAELTDRFQLLATESEEFVERHQKLWTCIDWSYAMYPEAHAFLKVLAVFRGGWTLESSRLASGLSSVNSLTQTLLRSSLIQEVSREAAVRFDMFEAIREFVRANTSPTEAANAAEAHASAMKEWLYSDAVRLQPFDGGYIPTRAAEIENIRAAFEWSLTNRPAWALDFVNGLTYYWWSRDLFREGAEWITRAIDANPKQQSTAYAMAHRGLATMNTGLNEYKRAYDIMLAGLEFFPAVGDEVQKARFYNSMGNASANFDPNLSVKNFMDGMELAEKHDESLLFTLRGNMAFALLMAGQLDEAEAAMTTSIEEVKQASNADWHAQFLHNFGLIAKTRGDWAEAERRFGESRKSVENTTVNPATRGWLTDLGVVVMRQQRLQEALGYLKESAAGVRKTKGTEAFVDLIEAMAEWCDVSGEKREAVALLAASAKLGTPGQRSIADQSMTGFERLATLREKMSDDEFRNAAQRYRGMKAHEILEEIEDYEPVTQARLAEPKR